MSLSLMSKKRSNKAKPVDKARPFIRKSKATDVAKVTITRSITTQMKTVPQWNAPGVQAAATAWNSAADAIDAQATLLADLRKKMEAAMAAQRANRLAWEVSTRQMLSVIEVVCQGSPDAVHAAGFDVQTHVAAVTQPVPAGVVAQPGSVSGTAVVSWQRGSARRGFVLQHAADPANPATISPAIVCTKTKYLLEGATPRSSVGFRVAAIDPTSSTGTSPWSDWVTSTVR